VHAARPSACVDTRTIFPVYPIWALEAEIHLRRATSYKKGIIRRTPRKEMGTLKCGPDLDRMDREKGRCSGITAAIKNGLLVQHSRSLFRLVCQESSPEPWSGHKPPYVVLSPIVGLSPAGDLGPPRSFVWNSLPLAHRRGTCLEVTRRQRCSAPNTCETANFYRIHHCPSTCEARRNGVNA